jgi:hypothetical protein
MKGEAYGGGENHELESEIDFRRAHGGSHVFFELSVAPWERSAECAAGHVSSDGWSMGHFCFAVCEVEVNALGERKFF